MRLIHTMFKLLSLLVLVSCATAGAVEDANLKSLPLAARQSLTQWNFKFKTFAESDFTPEVQKLFEGSAANEKPMMLTLDLNNDKTDDYVLMGDSDKQQFVVALVSDKKNFKTVVVDTLSDVNLKKNLILYLAIPGQDEPATIALKKKAKSEIFDVESYMGPSMIFAIKDYKAMKLNK